MGLRWDSVKLAAISFDCKRLAFEGIIEGRFEDPELLITHDAAVVLSVSMKPAAAQGRAIEPLCQLVRRRVRCRTPLSVALGGWRDSRWRSSKHWGVTLRFRQSSVPAPSWKADENGAYESESCLFQNGHGRAHIT
jgi:hypothetical protein